MIEPLDKRYQAILEQERLFIKRAVYYIHAYTPRPWWQIFIPLKFLLEYHARKKDVQSFEKSHLYLKEIALAMAYQEVSSENPGSSDPELLARLRDYQVHIQKSNSADLQQGLGQWLKHLKNHYGKLLQVQEKKYHLLLRKAYNTKQNYQSFLVELAVTENRVDRTLLELHQDGKQTEAYLDRKQRAFELLREREVRETFGEG